MFHQIPFRQFDQEILKQDEKDMLSSGMRKHRRILIQVSVFLLPQIALAGLVEEVMTIMTAASFISMMLCTSWYSITFQNVSKAQLEAGVADFITRKMFRAFVLSFSMLIACIAVFMVKTVFPELELPRLSELPAKLRILLLLSNMAWVLLAASDVYFASVGYDAADSLLGDGFPTLMRGAQANHQNLPLLKILIELARQQGVDVEKALKQED